MAVTFDAAGTGVDSITGQSSPFTLTTLTVGAGANRGIVAQIAWLAAAPAGLTVNWDSAGTPQALTLIPNASVSGVNGQTVQLWGGLAPTSGNKTLSVAWSAGTTELMLQAVSWTGVNQTSVAVAFPNGTSATGNNATATVNVTSAVGNSVMACCVAGSLQAISSVNNTQTFLLHGHGNLEAGGNRADGAASVTMSGTYAGTDQWAIVGTDIAAVPLGPTISVQPSTQVSLPGATATFTITATSSGGVLHYQWKKNGSNVGSDSSSYTTPAATLSDNLSTIQCVTTDDNGNTNSDSVYWMVTQTASEWLYKA